MCREERHRDTEIYWAGVTLILPQSLPLADIAAPFHRNGFEVSIANPAEYAEVEALARVADRDEIFERLTAHLLSWFVDENPAGPGFLVVARSSSDQAVVGHFLFYANTLLIAGRDGGVEACPSYLYVHLYVAPAFRRLGVFAAMFAFGQTVLARMGVRFAYTVPNPRSSPGFVKFGVPLLGALPVRMAPAWASWEALVRFAAPGNAGVDVERTQVFDGDMVKAAGTRPTTAVRGARTVDLLAWRFLRRPGTNYGIWRVHRRGTAAGYVVTRVLTIRTHRVLAICDLALDRLDAGSVAQIVRHVRRGTTEAVDLVMLQGGPREPASRRALLRAGLVHVPDRLLPQPVAVFGGEPARPGSTSGLPLLHQWELTPCDWDVF